MAKHNRFPDLHFQIREIMSVRYNFQPFKKVITAYRMPLKICRFRSRQHFKPLVLRLNFKNYFVQINNFSSFHFCHPIFLAGFELTIFLAYTGD